MKTRTVKKPGMKVRKTNVRYAATRSARNRECRAIFAALSDFMDGTLPVGNCRKLREHLKGCEPCIQYLDSLNKTVRLCRVYEAAPCPPMPPEVREALMKSLCKQS